MLSYHLVTNCTGSRRVEYDLYFTAIVACCTISPVISMLDYFDPQRSTNKVVVKGARGQLTLFFFLPSN